MSSKVKLKPKDDADAFHGNLIGRKQLIIEQLESRQKKLVEALKHLLEDFNDDGTPAYCYCPDRGDYSLAPDCAVCESKEALREIGEGDLG